MRFELYSPAWRSAVIQLAGEVFGEGYFLRPSEIPGVPGSVIIVGQERGETLLGFAQGRLLPESGLRSHLGPQVVDIPPEIADADGKGVLGVIQAIAVAPPYRRYGIGTKLVRVLHDRIVGLGADKLIVTFKRGPSAAPVDGMMGKLGFQLWTRLPTYWRSACESGDFKCPDRENGCTCEALLYRKAVFA